MRVGGYLNYYEHHLGDYAQATSHLSFVEDAAYCRMLRKYYADERPLPPDVRAVQRLVSARTEEERAAVEAVLQEFFQLREDGWHNARADEELDRYRAGEPERAARRANEQLRLRRHREERTRLFADLHAVGISAPWNVSMVQLKALHDQHCRDLKPAETPETFQVGVSGGVSPAVAATAPATPDTATHTPVSSHQTPDTNPNPVHTTRAREPSGPTPEQILAEYPPTPNGSHATALHQIATLIGTGEATGQELLEGTRRFARFVADGGRSDVSKVEGPQKFYVPTARGDPPPWAKPWDAPVTRKPETAMDRFRRINRATEDRSEHRVIDAESAPALGPPGGVLRG